MSRHTAGAGWNVHGAMEKDGKGLKVECGIVRVLRKERVVE
jgi:hypothetical protein